MAALALAFGLATSANALVSRQASCCFSVTANGGPGGQVGQISDGQTRIGQSLPAAQFCLSSTSGNGGAITDSAGRGCILTAPTSQFQCDQGATPQSGFAVSSNGEVTYNGSPSFYACQITQGSGSYNIYTSPSGINCVSVTLTASNSNCASSSGAASQASSPAASSPVASSPASPSAASPSAASPSAASPSVVSSQASSPAASSPVAAPSSEQQSQQTPKASTPVAAPSSQQQSQQTPVAFTPKASSPVVASSPQQTPVASSPVAASSSQQTPVASSPVAASSPKQQSQETSKASSMVVVSTPQQQSQQSKQTPVASTPVAASTPQQQSQQSQQTPVASTSVAASTPQQQIQSAQTPAPSVASPAPASSQAQSSAAAPSSSAPPSSSSCPANLQGNYQYPHLIVPINSNSPNAPQGTSYNGTITPSSSSIFNFDVPQSYAGQTCSLVFLLPQQGAVSTSDYSLSGSGQVDFSQLSGVASQSTSASNAPAVATGYGVQTVSAGSALTVASFACPAGQTVAYEARSVGGTSLEYFQDYNAPGIGLYITSC